MRATEQLGLLERESELESLRRRVRAAAEGTGGVVVIEGPAGIGKSALVQAAGELASEAGLRLLHARGGELEQEFGLGVVRQLFDRLVTGAGDARRSRWSAGAAAGAVAMLTPGPPAAGPLPEAGFGLLHSLYWLTVDAADDGPVALVVDDAQWADEPSARFVRFLAARVATLPVLVIVASRADAWSSVGLGPGADLMRPSPLSEAALATWLAAALDEGPDEGFVRACHEATAGHPFLVRELVRELSVDGVRPIDAATEVVASLSPGAVRASIRSRLTRLPAGATEFARALAVLDHGPLELVAGVAGLDPERAAEVAGALARSEIVTGSRPLGFTHAIVRRAVYDDISLADRERAHAAAARLLAARSEPSDRVAGHVLRSAPGSMPWAVTVLRSAAGGAARAGGLGVAVDYLARAAQELPAGSRRAEVLTELGEAEALAGRSSPAAEHLRDAIAEAGGAAERVRAAVALASALRFAGRGPEALQVLREAGTGLDGDAAELAALVDLELLGAASLSAHCRLALAPWLAEHVRDPGRPPGSAWELMSLSYLALDGALRGAPAEQVVDRAVRAVAARGLIGAAMSSGQVASIAALALMIVGRFTQAGTIIDQGVEATARALLGGPHAAMLANRASWHLQQGHLDAAADDARRALDLGSEVEASRSLLPRAASVLVSVAAARGRVPSDDVLAYDADPDALNSRLYVHARAELAVAQGHVEDGVAALLAYGELNVALGWPGAATPWRSQAALGMHRLGRDAPARRLVDEELSIAAASGVPRAHGIALRAVAVLSSGSEREHALQAAVDVLDGSGADLELARTLTLLGVERRDQGATRVARELLGRAHELAIACGADPLAETTAAELRRAGARPRRVARTGVASLTGAERRVADLVGEAGLTNREAAQALFVTEKTVETHLSHVYAKLGIAGRRELGAALAGPSTR